MHFREFANMRSNG
jgi:chromobox protein 1